MRDCCTNLLRPSPRLVLSQSGDAWTGAPVPNYVASPVPRVDPCQRGATSETVAGLLRHLRRPRNTDQTPKGWCRHQRDTVATVLAPPRARGPGGGTREIGTRIYHNPLATICALSFQCDSQVLSQPKTKNFSLSDLADEDEAHGGTVMHDPTIRMESHIRINPRGARSIPY